MFSTVRGELGKAVTFGSLVACAGFGAVEAGPQPCPDITAARLKERNRTPKLTHSGTHKHLKSLVLALRPAVTDSRGNIAGQP
jgi:hypothetical protein